MNSLSLTAAYLRHRALSTVLTITTFAAGIAMIVVMMLLNSQLQNEFSGNLKGIDLVVGAKGSPLQLILSSVFHLDVPTGNIPLDEAEKLGKHPLIKETIPLSLGDNFQGYRIVGTTKAYPEHYRARLKGNGRYWQKEMEVVLGAETAGKSGLKPGDTFAGSHGLAPGGEVHSEFPYTVVGILEPTGSVLDRLVLTGRESVWYIHDHHDNDEDADEHHQEAAPAHQDKHHVDADKRDREITSFLVFYNSPMAAAMFPRLVNGTTSMQAASPAFEVARLTSFMGTGTETLKCFAWFLILLAGFAIFAGLYNAMNERRYDLALMRSFGARPGKLFALMMSESLAISLVSAGLGAVTGHLLVEGIATWLATTKHIHMTGKLFLPEEAWILLLSLLVGGLAALLPAIRVYRIDIFKTLVQR